MNAYFFKMTNEEKTNILDQHKEIYDGYLTSYAQPAKEQPLYTQSYANDKQGLTVSNKGVVTGYKNMGINEMWADKKSTGLFSSEEPKEGYIPAGSEYTPEESFESEMDEEYYVSLGEQLDMIGDGNHDLEHGTFGHEDEEDEILVSPEFDEYEDENEDKPLFNVGDKIFDDENDIDDEEVEGLFDDLRESLDMFKRFTKYN